jgi:hypothetical protein
VLEKQTTDPFSEMASKLIDVSKLKTKLTNSFVCSALRNRPSLTTSEPVNGL